MNDYTRASKALKQAVITALNDDNIDPNTLSELWRHFLGVQAIAEKLKTPEVKFHNIPTEYKPSYEYNYPSDDIQIFSSYSDDILSLG